jgi:hypothetical protein
MTELNLAAKRLELINLTFDELVEFCLDLLIQMDCMEEMHKKEIEHTYDAGASHGYADGMKEYEQRR